MIAEGIKWSKSITMETVVCCKCGVPFGMPSDLNQQFKSDPNESFFCPNGHRQHYSKSSEQLLKEEYEAKLRRTENQLAQQQAQAIQLEAELNKANKKLMRVQKGVCPCCNRTFNDLARHMKMKHPEHTK